LRDRDRPRKLSWAGTAWPCPGSAFQRNRVRGPRSAIGRNRVKLGSTMLGLGLGLGVELGARSSERGARSAAKLHELPERSTFGLSASGRVALPEGGLRNGLDNGRPCPLIALFFGGCSSRLVAAPWFAEGRLPNDEMPRSDPDRRTNFVVARPQARSQSARTFR